MSRAWPPCSGRLAEMLAGFRAPIGLALGAWLTWRDSTAQLLEALESALAQKIAIPG
jgi:hypothetical protein